MLLVACGFWLVACDRLSAIVAPSRSLERGRRMMLVQMNELTSGYALQETEIHAINEHMDGGRKHVFLARVDCNSAEFVYGVRSSSAKAAGYVGWPVAM